MWAKSIQEGGVVGGTNNYVPGEGYYIGTTYNRRFNNPIIIYGILYYTEPQSIEVTTNTAGGLTKAVDLRTGEEIWSQRIPGPNNIFQLGYVYTSGPNPNMHGTWPGILFTADFGRAFDALTGNPMFNVTNIPVTRAISPTTSVGTETLGDDGTIYLYQLNAAGKWLAQWNSSKLWTWGTTPTIPTTVVANVPLTPARPTGAPAGQAYNWNGTAWVLVPSAQATQIDTRYDWNVSIPSVIPSNARIVYTIQNDMVLLTNITTATGFGPSASGTQPYMVAALSLKPATRGNLTWITNTPQPPLTRSLYGKLVDEENRIFLAYDKETSEIQGYSLDDGSHLWTATVPAESSDFILYSYLGAIGLQTAYGLVYFGGYGGILHAYDIKTGNLLWTYGNGGPGNTTYSGTGLAYGRYPIYPGPIANGVIYLDTGEHSAQPPLYKGSLVRALNATTGKEIWTLPGWGGHHRREGFAVADGYLTFLNHYDMRIYSVGKGPSATTVSASPKVSVNGDGVLVEGTVIDTAAGTKQTEQAARFPNGVPAVSDASQSAWMEYVYMQKPRPKDITGVEVTLSVNDPNGNTYDIGKATSDSNGMYKMMFTPQVPGEYTVIARFAGSEAYWPSYAETAIGVEAAPAPPETPASPPPPMTDTYVLGSTIGIIVAIAVGVAVIVFVLRKR
jgi:outer membrane protein assembly factor BamB